MSSFKAFEKRKKTLLVEYKNQFKSNRFTDKRIGENDHTLSLEDKMFKRFVVERQKQKKSNRYNLNDDDEFGDNFDDSAPRNQMDLTHFGQSLAQIEKFERVELSDDDDEAFPDPNDVDKGKINAKIVSENFFGGFKDSDEADKKKGRKEWIEEMIMKSKQIKYEKQKERDKTLDLTEELDKEWRSIMPLIGSFDKKLKEQEKEKGPNNAKPDDYDILVRSLQFENEKAQPTNKAKTEAEIEKERQAELKKQQKDLLDRMANEVEETESDDDDKKSRKSKGMRKIPINHVSVDDMEFDDPEYLEARKREEIVGRRKTDAEVEKKEHDKNNKKQKEKNGETEEESGYGEDDGEDGSESDDDENEQTASVFDSDKWVAEFEAICLKMSKKAIKVNEFESLIKKLIENLDPSRHELNKDRLFLLTKKLVAYYQSLFQFKTPSKLTIDVNLVNLLTKFIYDLTFKYGNKSTKKDPSKYVALFKEILDGINEKHVSCKISERKFPQLDILLTFKLISNVFPTSDYRHQIVTPSLLIMTRYLTECSVQTVGDCFRGIFLCNLCHEFVSKARRFVPECVQFLNGILYLATDWSGDKSSQVASLAKKFEMTAIYEAFKKTKVKFVLSKKMNEVGPLSLVNTSLIDKNQTDDATIVSILAYAVDLMHTFAKTNDHLVAFREVYGLTSCLLKLLPVENYSPGLKDRIVALEELIAEVSGKPREFLKCLDKKPVVGKMFEPQIVAKTKFDPRHHNHVISEKQLNARKYKKELKSAIKEIKQDSQFISRVRLEEQMEKDSKRKRKVKEIMGSLANQEGEFQKAKRMKG